ncbi:hypothetical protein A3D88_03040 [Candidatus Peribacteria bacterium RIFCSPHIGHO2_02_FULL_52_16]|nr:MAG: hypothetical protein A2706_06105 [Candidatus Peribacteria bacterium RIFCSPHIGHO2_01_FULL_51_35]OGJ60656.1 MAG: hypothetical protein A3D88_03040 [Candidatus Peribacteria bacterium RIFCSPHIGHO2_02_FULL_52_16]
MSPHAPEAAHGTPDHGNEAAKGQAEAAAKAADTITKAAGKAKEKVHKTLGDAIKSDPHEHGGHPGEHAEHHDARLDPRSGGRTLREKLQPLPRLPSVQTFGKAAMVGAFVPFPLFTTVVAGSLAVWKKARKVPPFSWAEKGVRKTVSAGVEGVKSGASILSYPLRLAGTVGMNALTTVGHVGYKVLDKTILEGYRDLRYAVNHHYKLKDPHSGEEVNLLSAALFGLKAAGIRLVAFPFQLTKIVAESMGKHPVAWGVGCLACLGALASANFSPIIAATNVGNAVASAWQLIMSKIAAIPVPPVVPVVP